MQHSLKNHVWQFRQTLVSDSSFEVLGILETRLGPEIDDSHIDIPNLHSALRHDRNLGGEYILLHVKNNLTAKISHDSKTTQWGNPLRIEDIF